MARALNEIIKALRNRGLIPAFLAKVEELRSTTNGQPLPGFTAFTRGGQLSPYQWLLPKPTCDADDFMNVYEGFADRTLGTARRPGMEALGIYRRSAEGRKLLTFLQGRGQWESTGLIFIAAAQHLGATVEYCTPSATRLKLDGEYLEVTDRGCWSNFRQRIMLAAEREVEPLATTFRENSTTNPVLKAVVALSDDLDYGVMWAASTISLALQAGVINRKGLQHMVDGRTANVRRHIIRDRDRQVSALAVKHCQEILVRGGDNLMQSLYVSCVPSVMSAREFRRMFGDPNRQRARRKIAESTRARWSEKLAIYVGGEHADD